MKEKNTNKTDRVFLDVYPRETHPQEAESSEQAVCIPRVHSHRNASAPK